MEYDRLKSEGYDNKHIPITKLNAKYHNYIKTEKEKETDEINELLDFAHNLDFDKYMKDLEIREALRLIKNKVEEEKPAEEVEQIENEDNENIENQKAEAPLILPRIENNKEKNNQTEHSPYRTVEHDKQWNVSI